MNNPPSHPLNTLWLRLALSFLGVALLVIISVAGVVWYSLEVNFNAYVLTTTSARFSPDLIPQLQAHYAQFGTWEGAAALLPARGRGENAGAEGRGVQLFVTDSTGIIVLATQAAWRGRPPAEIGPFRAVDLVVNGVVVGQLGEQTPGAVALAEAERRFLRDFGVGLLATALTAGLIVLGLAVWMAFSLTRPLRTLTAHIGSWQLRGGPDSVPVSGPSEIRQLGAAFNDLIRRLGAAEEQRQRLTADVAHELRTPVTVMRGHLEAMMDGVYPLDTAHLAVAYNQTLHLNRLVEDLRLLTLAEAGRLPLHMAAVRLPEVIGEAVARFAPLAQDRNLQITAAIPPTLPHIQADPMRLQQVLDNLLSNALRYTPEGGQIAVRAWAEGSKVWAALYNQSAEALTDEQIAHLFDRFWRADSARERDSGGSGLGLAITRELVRAQGGEIRAQREGAGITFVLGFVKWGKDSREMGK